MTRLTQQWRSSWWRYRYPAAVVVGVAIGLCARTALIFLSGSQQALRAEIVSTPRGGVVFWGPVEAGAPELLRRIAATPSRDAYFFYPYLPILPFLTAREQASKYDIFTPGYTSPSQYRDACISVMQQASWVVIDRRGTRPDVLKQTFPTMRETEPQETKRFEQALDDGFKLFAKEGAFELRRRRDGMIDALCAEIAD